MTDEIAEAEAVAQTLTELISDNRGEVDDINLVGILSSVIGEIVGVNEAHGCDLVLFEKLILLNIHTSRMRALQQEQEQIKKEMH